MTGPPVSADTDRAESGLVLAYSQLIASLTRRYGPSSQAVMLTSFDYLLALCDFAGGRSSAVGKVRHQIDSLIRELSDWYSLSEPVGNAPPVQVLDKELPLLQFDRVEYERRYGIVGLALQREVRVVDDHVLSTLLPARPYNYVIDECGQLIVHMRPLNFRDLVFSRRAAGQTEVTHPMLVHDTLSVMAAGEIAFVGYHGRVSTIVANTKSGHYWPPPPSAAALRRVCDLLFHLRDEDTIVFVVNDARRPTAS